MEKWVLLFLVCFSLKALSQDTWDWVSIDCGSGTSYRTESGILWETDEEYIKTGRNKGISGNRYSALEQMNSLRVFTQQNKNCYTLPAPTMHRYMIRAAFYYGNYDGLSKPPTFDLEFDGNKWITVVTSTSNVPVYYEVIYASKGDNISVCLAQTQANQFPFISSLESWPLPDDMYAGIGRDVAWLNSHRYNYGATDWIIGYPDDEYNRIWEPMIPSGLIAVTANFTVLDSTTVDLPPDLAIIDAVEAQNPTDTISLPFTFSKNTLNHVIVHYTEPEILESDETRSFDFYVNNKFILTTSPVYKSCTGAWDTTQSTGTLTVELRPTADSTLPPIISAIEVYTASDPLVTTGTSQDDLDGLSVFISTFEQLQGWSGEPCLPSDTVWQWLGCTGDDPPRVTSLNLSGYGLDGPLPEFSQMKALQTIDLGNNSLDGPIPDFLGDLPNLKLLNLRDNNFSGDIPHSITSNKKITCYTKGNPKLHHHKGKKKALIIGLAVGIPLGVIILVALLVFFLTRKQPRPSQEQVTATQLVKLQGENGATQAKPPEEQVSPTKPSQANEHIKPVPAEENVRINVNAGSTDQPSAIPNMNADELDELLQQHGSIGANGKV